MIKPLAGLAGATAISGLGTGMTMLAIPWFVLDTTGSTLHTGTVVAAETAGLLTGSALSGRWVDRLGPRRAAVVFDLAAAAVVAAIPALHHLDRLSAWALSILAAALGLSRSPGSTARQVLIPDIAARTNVAVERVTSAHDAPEQGAQALGAPVAGVVIALLGAPASLLLDAASFLISALITRATLSDTTRASSARRGPTWSEGWRFLRGDRTLTAVMAMVAVTNGLNAGLFSVLVPAYGVWVLDSPVSLGAVFAATGAALVAGSVAFAAVGLRWRRWPTLVVCYLLVLGPRAGVFPAAAAVLGAGGSQRSADAGLRAAQPDPRRGQGRTHTAAVARPGLRHDHHGRPGRNAAGHRTGRSPQRTSRADARDRGVHRDLRGDVVVPLGFSRMASR